MPRRHDNKGRSNVEAVHVRLYRWMTSSDAWRALSAVERCVYIELARRYDGKNNGYLALPCRAVAAELGISKMTVSRAIARLVALGFVEITQRGAFSRKVRHAAEYRLTEHNCDRTGQLPSKAFMRWQPEPAENSKRGNTTFHGGICDVTVRNNVSRETA